MTVTWSHDVSTADCQPAIPDGFLVGQQERGPRGPYGYFGTPDGADDSRCEVLPPTRRTPRDTPGEKDGDAHCPYGLKSRVPFLTRVQLVMAVGPWQSTYAVVEARSTRGLLAYSDCG